MRRTHLAGARSLRTHPAAGGFTYGPHECWEELWIRYHADLGPELRRCGFITDERPIWYVGEPGPLLGQLASLDELLGACGRPGLADRVDRVAEAMVLSSLVHAQALVEHPAARAVAEIRSTVEERCLDPHDFHRLAAMHGLSPATFRRQWQRLVGIPPQRYLSHLRLRRACSLLVETDEPIGDIARRLGFEDPLYFSRRFRAVIGETAREHRRRLRHATG